LAEILALLQSMAALLMTSVRS